MTVHHQLMFKEQLGELTLSGNPQITRVKVGTEVFETKTETWVSITRPGATRSIVFKRMPDGQRNATFRPRVGNVNTTGSANVKGELKSVKLPSYTTIRRGRIIATATYTVDRLSFVTEQLINLTMTVGQIEIATKVLELHAPMAQGMRLKLRLAMLQARATMLARMHGGFFGGLGNTGTAQKKKWKPRFRIHAFTKKTLPRRKKR